MILTNRLFTRRDPVKNVKKIGPNKYSPDITILAAKPVHPPNAYALSTQH